MKKQMDDLGVGTTTLKAGVIPILTLFSVQISMLVRSGTSCDHRCCSPAKDFGYSPPFDWLNLRQSTRTKASWIHFSCYLRAKRILIQV